MGKIQNQPMEKVFSNPRLLSALGTPSNSSSECLNTPDFGLKPKYPSNGSFCIIIDPNDSKPRTTSPTNENIRNGFIRKVYLILLSQLTINVAVVAIFALNRPIQVFALENPQLSVTVIFIVLAVIIVMGVCKNARRDVPMNLICLGILTTALSYLIGATLASFRSEEVFPAMGITIILYVISTLFAMQTKINITIWGDYVLVAIIVMLLFGIETMFADSNIVKIVNGGFGALLGCIYLISYTQSVLGRNHKRIDCLEEYIFAALNLYLCFIMILLHIWQFLVLDEYEGQEDDCKILGM